MINHYNAFISYKHAPEDNKVAEAVHKGLERFHIPDKIRKKTGMKKIDRIFRDKDELPITSDLSDTIAHALENSDYLIVICSTNTKESAWVPREIEYFLRNHTKRDIFTVLVNGEPYDVIPEILLYEDKVVTDENGNEQKVRMPIEPLSCDFRTTPGKAKKTELPRLASGIIGCSYDELMNRHRQYKLKQLTAVVVLAFSIMACFSGYMFYSRNKIHKTYLEALNNQSKYLANESGNLLNKEQRITALQLALEALPKDDLDDRPVTPEAVKALTDATLAYQGNNGTNINAAWNYQMPNMVSDFCVSKDGKTIVIFDSGNVVGVWNTVNHERIMYLDDSNEDVNGAAFLDDQSFIIWTDNKIFCYDISSKAEKWNYTLEGSLFTDKKNLMIFDDTFYIATGENIYLQLKSDSGEVVEEISLPQKEGYEGLGAVESKLSPDGRKIAFRGLIGWNNYVYGVFDISSKKMEVSDILGETVKDIGWAGEDKIVVVCANVDGASSMSMGTSDILSSDQSKIFCVDANDLSEKWKTDFVCNGVMVNSDFVDLGNNNLAYYSGNVINVYDAATGEMKYSNNVNSSVVDVSDVDKDGSPSYITEDGGYAIPALGVDEDAAYYKKYFAEDLRQAVVTDGVYVRQNYSREVIYYGVHVYDDNWKSLDDETVISNVSDEFVVGESRLGVVSEDDKGPLLTIFDMDGKSKAVQIRLEGEKVFNYRMLGVYDDRIYLGYNNGNIYNLFSSDFEGKEVKNEELFEMDALFDNSCTLNDGKLIYVFQNDDREKMLGIYDIVTAKKTEWDIPEDLMNINHVPVYYEADNAVYIKGDVEYVVDVENGKFTKVDVPEDWTGMSVISAKSSDGDFAVSDRKQILITDKSGAVKNTIRCPGITPLGMTFIGDELLVSFNDGSLIWYKKSDGQIVKRSDTSMYYGYDGEVNFEYIPEKGLMVMQMGMLTDIIDLESGVETAHITRCYGYNESRDIFLTESKESENNIKVGYYKRYTFKELIDKAHNILQNAKLSDEMKSRYGIE